MKIVGYPQPESVCRNEGEKTEKSRAQKAESPTKKQHFDVGYPQKSPQSVFSRVVRGLGRLVSL
jgi:hypothetical protein